MACASAHFSGQLAEAGGRCKAEDGIRAHSKPVLSTGKEVVLGVCACITFYLTKTKINFT